MLIIITVLLIIMWLLLWEAWGAMSRFEWTNCYFNRYFNSYGQWGQKQGAASQLLHSSWDVSARSRLAHRVRWRGSCGVGSSLSLPTLGEITWSVLRLYRDSASASLSSDFGMKGCVLPAHIHSLLRWEVGPLPKNWLSQRAAWSLGRAMTDRRGCWKGKWGQRSEFYLLCP